MWANQSVLGLGKWYAKSKTCKFHPGIAFTICPNQLHLQKNGHKRLNLVSKMALKKWNSNFPFWIIFLFLPEIFLWNDRKVITFHLLSWKLLEMIINLLIKRNWKQWLCKIFLDKQGVLWAVWWIQRILRNMESPG